MEQAGIKELLKTIHKIDRFGGTKGQNRSPTGLSWTTRHIHIDFERGQYIKNLVIQLILKSVEVVRVTPLIKSFFKRLETIPHIDASQPNN